jgi:hypothetical protein
MTADVFADASVVINRMVTPDVVANLTHVPDMTKLNIHAQFLGRAFYFRKHADNACLAGGMTHGPVKSPASNAATLAELKSCKGFRIPADKWLSPPAAGVTTPGYLECTK